MENEALISLENLIALLPNHVYWLNKEGVYQGCNEAQAKMLGLGSRDEIVGKRNKDLAFFKNHPEFADAIDKNNLMVIQSNKAQQFEEIVRDTNGTISTYLSHKVPLRDSNNMVIGLLGSSYKIDEIKAKEEKLIAEKENVELTLKSIIAHLPGHVYWKDKEGRYLGCNDKQANSLGFNSGAEIVSKTDFELPWPKGSAEKFRENDLEVISTGKSKTAEEKATIDGKDAIVLSQKVPLTNRANETYGVLGISLDITELKRAQENEKLALQKSAADEATKRALLIFSGMSTHDLRTPLSSINLRAAFLKKYIPALTEGYKAAAEADFDIPHLREAVLTDLQQAPLDILQGVREANEYIDACLKSLKGASLGDKLIDKAQLIDCNAERLLRRIIDNYPYKENQQQLLHWDHEHDFNFKGNVIFFNRLIENLIKNAFEQIELKGRGEIFINCGENDKFNTIAIKDTAGGVTQAIIDKMFQGIQSTKQGGTGIGLSSAKQIMQGMNGDIECQLVDGDCIEFCLSFPQDIKK